MVRIRHTQTREEREVAPEAVPYFPGWFPVPPVDPPVTRKTKRTAGETGQVEEMKKTDG